MKTITLSDEDAAQVKAIMMMHAEMQDHRSLEAEAVLGRLQRDEPDSELIHNMVEDGQDIADDVENLKRIAALF